MPCAAQMASGGGCRAHIAAALPFREMNRADYERALRERYAGRRFLTPAEILRRGTACSGSLGSGVASRRRRAAPRNVRPPPLRVAEFGSARMR